ncbi:class I SAM-dependent methyltransferase [Alloalcanivorax xenomutans]|jgi:ubiquinone/menaquinone biosynthesis C-methylase UbiE|uniref:Class I SAM-dependent methyltransferase n=1 Tax=Alloalcanivorax xenomutans TaxID=1094342 RepID=A0A9Q3ZCX4_9GAMM|nr:class I SAM-dependent methyltransferase [Alloalcanivorax xenomutans]MBA4720972.1 class I SAM-dependent methyltransferase [Alcanivorax sp.]ARB44269.1 SAM-dependent methyltransferase [Alloalcanivorax xenomutans]MCE7508845.1 class I SAM-dependent methyltransferase [Alloalcanivorax xenomutans]PHS70471.1 MAG: class I SAM-dependent methyltransferase [Alcanivorax sp.]WOA31809.1 class I SAM-dependent methyltransferase [Alloalcanivorax xenomutans]|tara:strand:+ start:793 stop:1416 length:624 start_codon:yes stop_codon:yes gene_type:complete
MKSAKVFWDKAAPRYAKSPVKDEETYRKKLSITQSYLQRDWSVLEFGCGTGSTAIQHAAHVGRILATDVSPRMLEIAEGKVREAGITNIRFQEGSLETLKLASSSFDAVLGLNILHLLEDVPGAVRCVHTLLKPGGIFVSSTALVAEMAFYWRWVIPVMQRLGLAPYVSPLSEKGLVTQLTDAGFHIDHEWRVTRESVFIIARKPLI